MSKDKDKDIDILDKFTDTEILNKFYFLLFSPIQKAFHRSTWDEICENIETLQTKNAKYCNYVVVGASRDERTLLDLKLRLDPLFRKRSSSPRKRVLKSP
jgi:hypothetical protein